MAGVGVVQRERLRESSRQDIRPDKSGTMSVQIAVPSAHLGLEGVAMHGADFPSACRHVCVAVVSVREAERVFLSPRTISALSSFFFTDGAL